jgi:hypothetical protein
MTPKEKALELVHKFLNCKDYSNSYYVIPIQEDATRCALIAVDEILWMASHYVTIQYWNEVKQEIEKL